MQRQGKIAFICGKTGGHFIPPLIVADGLRERFSTIRCVFLGTKQGLDNRLINRRGECFYSISGSDFPPRMGIGIVKSVFNVVRAICEAFFILRKEKPNLIFAVGSYIALAPVIIAKLLKIPVLLYEPNICMGRANRFLARWADVVASGFPIYEVKSAHRKLRFTGHPIRRNLRDASRTEAIEHFALDPAKLTLLVVGGSQGAESINRCMLEAMDSIAYMHSSLQVIHLVGERSYDSIMQSYQSNKVLYKIYPYLDEMHLALRASDILISRAGASMIAEALYCKIPSILIPYPHAMEQHQLRNAKYVEDRGAAILLKGDSLNAQTLAASIKSLVENEQLRKELIKGCQSICLHDGTNNLVELVLEMISEKQRKNDSK